MFRRQEYLDRLDSRIVLKTKFLTWYSHKVGGPSPPLQKVGGPDTRPPKITPMGDWYIYTPIYVSASIRQL